MFWEGKVCEPSLRGVLSDEIQTSRKMTRRGVFLGAFQFQLISKKSLSLEVRSHGKNILSLSLSLSLSPFSPCVTLDKGLTMSVPQFIHL